MHPQFTLGQAQSESVASSPGDLNYGSKIRFIIERVFVSNKRDVVLDNVALELTPGGQEFHNAHSYVENLILKGASVFDVKQVVYKLLNGHCLHYC